VRCAIDGWSIANHLGYRWIAGRESLFNIVFSAYEFARLVFYDMKLKNCAPSDARVTSEQRWPERPNKRKHEWQPRRRKTSRTRS
jgi:hypothetical protein